MEIDWKKNTALFLTGQALSLFGTMVVQYAILWHITLKSQSGSMMTVFTLVGLLPMFFISPFAGVWVDRFNRKNIINIADGSIAFFSLIAAVLLILEIDGYVILLLCAFVRAVRNVGRRTGNRHGFPALSCDYGIDGTFVSAVQ